MQAASVAPAAFTAATWAGLVSNVVGESSPAPSSWVLPLNQVSLAAAPKGGKGRSWSWWSRVKAAAVSLHVSAVLLVMPLLPLITWCRKMERDGSQTRRYQWDSSQDLAPPCEECLPCLADDLHWAAKSLGQRKSQTPVLLEACFQVGTWGWLWERRMWHMGSRDKLSCLLS